MKPQDILFVLVFAVLLWKRPSHAFVWAGLLCLAAAIPLFSVWIFFTAERLTWYAAAFFGASILFTLRQPRKVQ